MPHKDREEHNKYTREYRKKNKEKINQKKRLDYQKYKDTLKFKEKNQRNAKIYYDKNKQKIFDRKKQYSQNNKEKLRIYRQEYYRKNKKKRDLYIKEWVRKNPDKVRGYLKKWEINNKEKINKKQRIWQNKKKKDDKDFALKCKLRYRLKDIFKIYTKTGKIMPSKKYGINYNKIIEHLKPLPNNLKNYHIHHIKPLHTFNFVNPDGSTNIQAIQEAFKPENHKLVTIEEHKEIHRNGNWRFRKN